MTRRTARRRTSKRSRIVLPFVREEIWDDGTHVIFREVPFLVGHKPFVPQSAHKNAHQEVVPLAKLVATQSVVTDTGLEMHSPGNVPRFESYDYELPMTYQKDGLYYIADGHHRLTARWLTGKKTARVQVVDVQPWM